MFTLVKLRNFLSTKKPLAGKAMTSMIWLEHFGKLLIVYGSSYRVESLIFHTPEENGSGCDSLSDS